MLNRDKFFDGLRAEVGGLYQKQVDALTTLLDAIEADPDMTDLRWIAYALATIRHETAGTYAPIAEYGKGKGHPYGKPDPETRQVYYGRGYCQITWRKNYEKFSELLGVDLVIAPDRAMEPEIAYQILSLGMRQGLFTGRKLNDYISGDKCDYLHARKIINAMDKAELIAGYAKGFETILNSAQEPEPAQTVTETVTKTAAQPATETQPATVEQSIVQKITSSDQVKEIASTGLSTVGNKLATGGISTGLLASIGAFVDKAWPLLIFAGVMIVLGFAVWMLIYHNQHKEKQIEAQIASDPARVDVHFAK